MTTGWSAVLHSVQTQAPGSDRARDFVSVDFSDGEDRYGREPADWLTVEKIFDANRAVTLLGQADEIRSLCDALIASEGRLRP